MSWRGSARRSVPFIVTAAAGFCIAYAVVALFIFPATLVANDVPVPNVMGLPWADASSKLSGAGLKPARGEQRYDNTAPAGAVLTQTPLPGEAEPKGSTVVLDLSRGQRLVDVPRLVGLTRQQAERVLANAGLDVGDVSEVDDDAPLGQVLSVAPSPGTRVPVPSPVSLTVSRGPAAVTIPDVTGQDYAAARTLLVQLGFTVGQVTFDSLSPLPRNVVIAQRPPIGSPARAGASVDLTVSAHQ